MTYIRAEHPNKFPSKQGNDNPVETEVNPDAPKGIEMPKGVRVPKPVGDRPIRRTRIAPGRHDQSQPGATI
jgi:hypothetical protein